MLARLKLYEHGEKEMQEYLGNLVKRVERLEKLVAALNTRMVGLVCVASKRANPEPHKKAPALDPEKTTSHLE